MTMKTPASRRVPRPRGAAELVARAGAVLHERGPTALYFRLLEEAALAGHPKAMADYGMWLLEGRRAGSKVVLERSPRRALQFLRAAAESGDADAQLALGDCLSEANGTTRNISEAAMWYRRAARQGERFAAFNLSTLYRDQGNRERERYWLKRADRLGEPAARLVLAEMDLVLGGERARSALQYLRRRAKAATEAVVDEVAEILEHFARTGRRRWARTGAS